MNRSVTRRGFLSRAVGASALAGLGDLGFLSRLTPVAADEAALDPRVVQLRPEIEPLVRLLEETPRDRLLEEVASRVRKGLGYREVLAALLLAGVRNVQPRPSVGFKFHAVLVVNSAHLASLSGPASQRWLPIFWALDYFKEAQARDVREGNWTMAPVEEARVPQAQGAGRAFVEAMERWDEPAADSAAAGFVRTAGAQRVFEELFLLGARDFRSIGHKAIFVANSWRTLACIGWHHSEPVVRSLAYALLQHEGDNPAGRDGAPDRPFRRNLERLEGLRVECVGGGEPDAQATIELLTALREGSDEDASARAAGLLRRGVSASSLWDAVFSAASELVLRRPGIISLHAATTSNALHFAFQTSGRPRSRVLLLLQAAAFIPLFREAARARGGGLADLRVDSLEPVTPEGGGETTVGEILADIDRDRIRAARRALGYLRSGDGNDLETARRARELIDAARLLVFLKGDDAHDYKYSSAVLEDYFHVSPRIRDGYLAASVSLLQGPQRPDNGLVERIRGALRAG